MGLKYGYSAMRYVFPFIMMSLLLGRPDVAGAWGGINRDPRARPDCSYEEQQAKAQASGHPLGPARHSLGFRITRIVNKISNACYYVRYRQNKADASRSQPRSFTVVLPVSGLRPARFPVGSFDAG
jgi:hypothetical protein